jgi:hypothetical protein
MDLEVQEGGRRMNRLTKDNVKKMGMFELMHNQVFVKDREAWYRDFEREVSVRQLAREMFSRNGISGPLLDAEFDNYMVELLYDGYETINGMIALYYNALCGFAEVRERLKKYEDLEEQGLLVKLPCKVGDTVYLIHEVAKSKRTIEPVKFGLALYNNLNKTVFLTEEEAKKALEVKQ